MTVALLGISLIIYLLNPHNTFGYDELPNINPKSDAQSLIGRYSNNIYNSDGYCMQKKNNLFIKDNIPCNT